MRFNAWRFWSTFCGFLQKSLRHMNHIMYEHIFLHLSPWVCCLNCCVIESTVHVAFFKGINMKHTIELGTRLGSSFRRFVSWCAVQRSAPLIVEDAFCSRLLHVGCISFAMFLCRRFVCGCVSTSLLLYMLSIISIMIWMTYYARVVYSLLIWFWCEDEFFATVNCLVGLFLLQHPLLHMQPLVHIFMSMQCLTEQAHPYLNTKVVRQGHITKHTSILNQYVFCFHKTMKVELEWKWIIPPIHYSELSWKAI